jgi:ribosome maturation factor RimP
LHLVEMAALTQLIEPEVNALGFDLVRVKLFGGDDQTLQVMAERRETRQLTRRVRKDDRQAPS